MKKVLCLLMVLVFAMSCVGLTASAAEYGIVLNNNAAIMVGNATAVANNALQTLSAAPVVVEGEVMIPYDAVPVLLNGTVSYDSVGKIIDMQFGTDKTVVMREGSKQYAVSGRMHELAVAPLAVNGVVMVPVRALAEAVIGKTVFYDAANQLMIISSRRVIKDSLTDAAVISTIANAMRTNSLPEITVPTYYEIDWSTVTGGAGGANYDVGQLRFVSVTASAEPEAHNGASNVMDGSTGTFWAIGDIGGTIVCDLGKVNAITEIKVAFDKYTQRGANYEILVSENGNRYESIYSGSSSQGQQWVSHSVNGTYRYVKLVSNGNTTGSSFNSIAEIQAFNGGTQSGNETPVLKLGEKLKFRDDVVATEEQQAENSAHNTIDDNIDTYWAAQGQQTITLDLGAAQPVTGIGVQMRMYDDGRSINYSVSYSADGSSYSQIFDGASAPNGGVMEQYPVSGNVRYVRVGVNGSTTGDWASVAEIVAYGPAGAGNTAGVSAGAQPGKLAIISARATSEPEADNNAAKAIDGSGSTYWAASGEQSITFDLGTAQAVGSVGVQMRKYSDGRSINYSVSYSADGTSYKQVYDGQSASNGGVMENHDVNATARYIKVGVNGSTTGEWSSVAEVEVYGAAGAVSGGIPAEFMLAVQGTNNVLTVTGDNFTLGLSDGNKDSKQLWSQAGATVKNKGTGFCLDVSEESMAEGAQICVWEGTGGTNQTWELEADGDCYLVKSGMSGLYLTVSGGNVQQQAKANATKWTLVGDASAGVSTYRNLSSVYGSFMLAVQGTTDVLTVDGDGIALKISKGSKSAAQLWTKEGANIVNAGSGRCLDVSEESMAEGAAICVWDETGGSNQSWALENKGDYYLVRSNHSGLYLTVSGNNLQQRSAASATKWVVTDGEIEITNVAITGGANVAGAFKKAAYRPGQFMIALKGSRSVITVGNDGKTLMMAYGTNDGTQIWSNKKSALKNRYTGNYIAIPNDAEGAGAVLYADSMNDPAWIIEDVKDGCLIKNKGTGLYLALVGATIQLQPKDKATEWVITNGELVTEADVAQSNATTPSADKETTNTNTAQNVNMVNVSGTFVINVYGSNDVLTVGSDDFTLSVGAYTNSGKQQWSLDGASVKNNGTGTFLDVSGQSYDAGAQICVWEGNGGDNQKWTLENKGDYYLVKSNMSGLYLAVSGGNVQQQSEANATKWVITAK